MRLAITSIAFASWLLLTGASATAGGATDNDSNNLKKKNPGKIRGQEGHLGRRALKPKKKTGTTTSKGSKDDKLSLSKKDLSCGLSGQILLDPSTSCENKIADFLSATPPPMACSRFNGGRTQGSTCASNPSNTCYAGGNSKACYDMGDVLGEVTIEINAVWEWSNYNPPFNTAFITDVPRGAANTAPFDLCGRVLTKADDPANLVTINSATGTPPPPANQNTGWCFDAGKILDAYDPLMGLTDPTALAPVTGVTYPVTSTVTITLENGESYVGEIIPGGTVCEVWASAVARPVEYKNVDALFIPFKIEIDGEDFEGYVSQFIDHTALVPIINGDTQNVVLRKV